MDKLIVFIYGIIAYLIGMGGLTFFILYIGGWNFMPIHIDSGIAGSLTPALIVNTTLILLFGLRHSIMTRHDTTRHDKILNRNDNILFLKK
jgi:hypothetical protein